MKLQSLALILATSSVLVSCERPPVDRNCSSSTDPAQCPSLTYPWGRIEGTVVYQGPEPTLDANGVPAGRVVLLLFSADNLPPPEGTATSAISFQSISASALFRNVTRLPDNSVRATVAYSFPNIITGGVYQVRAFYSRHDTINATIAGQMLTIPSGFEPLFSVRQLPVRGDVGGGALVDPNASPPVFQRIAVGDRVEDTTTHAVSYVIPEHGAVTRDVTVFIGSTFTFDRPVFHLHTPSMPDGSDAISRLTLSTAPPPPGVGADRPYELPVPSLDLVAHARETGLLPPGSPILEMRRNIVVQDAMTGTDLPSFTMDFNLDTADCATAALAGVTCPVMDAGQLGFYEQALDRNNDGRIDITAAGAFADIHPTAFTTNPLAAATNGRLPWLYPLVIFAKLHEPTPEEADVLARGINGQISRETYEAVRTRLNTPEGIDPAHNRYPVLLFGQIIPNGQASNYLLRPWANGYHQFEASVRISIVPIAVEVHGIDQNRDWWVMIPPGTAELTRAASAFLPPTWRCDRALPNVPLDDDNRQPSGIPAGRYAINFLGPGGQAWTTPNELAGFVRPAYQAPASNPTAAQTARANAETAALTSACTQVDGPNARTPFCAIRSQGLMLRIRGLENSDGYCVVPGGEPSTNPTGTCAQGTNCANAPDQAACRNWCAADPNGCNWPRRDPQGPQPTGCTSGSADAGM